MKTNLKKISQLYTNMTLPVKASMWYLACSVLQKAIVFVHSEKGMDLLKKIMGEMTYKEGNIEELLPNTADSRKSVSPHPNRNAFFAALDAGENCDELLKFVKPKVSIFGKVKRKLKTIVRMN